MLMPFDIQKFISRESTTPFYVPPTIVTDFKKYLMTDVPNSNFTFEMIHDWDNRPEEPEYIRAEMYPVGWKSRIGNADSTSNFRTWIGSGLVKGDILLREDGKYLMCVWTDEHEINNIKTQAQFCNMFLTIEREQGWEIDDNGALVTPDQSVKVVENLPVVGYNEKNKYEFIINNYKPGIVPNDVKTIFCQANERTRAIKLNDKFHWRTKYYYVINIEDTELDIETDMGLITIHCDQVPGGYDD